MISEFFLSSPCLYVQFKEIIRCLFVASQKSDKIFTSHRSDHCLPRFSFASGTAPSEDATRHPSMALSCRTSSNEPSQQKRNVKGESSQSSSSVGSQSQRCDFEATRGAMLCHRVLGHDTPQDDTLRSGSYDEECLRRREPPLRYLARVQCTKNKCARDET